MDCVTRLTVVLSADSWSDPVSDTKHSIKATLIVASSLARPLPTLSFHNWILAASPIFPSLCLTLFEPFSNCYSWVKFSGAAILGQRRAYGDSIGLDEIFTAPPARHEKTYEFLSVHRGKPDWRRRRWCKYGIRHLLVPCNKEMIKRQCE